VKQQGTMKDSVHVCTNVESTRVVPPRVACCCSQQIPGSLQQPFHPSSRPTACPSRWSLIATSRSKRLQQFITAGRRTTLQASLVYPTSCSYVWAPGMKSVRLLTLKSTLVTIGCTVQNAPEPFISFLLLFAQRYQEFCEEYAITADAENVPNTLEDKH